MNGINKVLRRRIPRELKTNLARYIALMLLFALGMYYVVAMVSAAETIIVRTAEHQQKNRVEDGQFSVFIPLTKAQEKQITDSGVTLEKQFSIDAKAADESTVRIMKTRAEINLIELDEGRLAESMGEAVVEKRYAEEHGLSVGDTLTVSDIDFSIVGLGTTPDYDAPYRKFSDTSVSSKLFGIIFVTAQQYDDLLENTEQKAQELTYAFILGRSMSYEKLKAMIKDFEFNYRDVTDKYYLEAVGEALQKRDDLRSGINELSDGANDLRDGINELSEGAAELSQGMDEIAGGAGELSEGLNGLSEGASELRGGTDELLSGAKELSGGLSELNGAAALISSAAENYEGAIEGYFEQSGLPRPETGYPISDGIKQFTDGISAAADGSSALYEGISQLNGGAKELEEGAEGAKSGAAELSDAMTEAAGGSAELAEGAKKAADGSEKLADGVRELKEQTDKLIDEVFDIDLDNLTGFVERADNIRIGSAAGDVVMNKLAGLAAGVIMMMLFTYVVSVFVVHQIQRESSVIGTLYALGAKKRDLIAHYIALPTVVAFVGAVIGSGIGFSPLGAGVMMRDSYSYFSLPEFPMVCPAYLIVYAVAMPPVVAALVNILVINGKLSRTALSLIRNEQKPRRFSGITLGNRSFVRNFQLRQILSEMRTNITVILCMVFSLLVLMLGLDTYTLCTNIGTDTSEDTHYEYMYTLKYPEKEPPVGGEICYVESLSITRHDYTLDVSIIGLGEDSVYYDVTPEKGKTKAIASKSVCERYGVGTGDKLILTDGANEMDYAFTIAGTCDYSAGLALFMDIGSMRELFGQEEDYYNCVLSDKPLDIEEGRLYAVTTKADLETSASVFVELMSGMVIMLMVCAVVILFAVMYLMQNVMVDRASFGISLVKIFGYGTKDVKRLYLDGNAITTAVGAVIGMPIAKLAMDSIFPLFIPNVACGIDLSYPWYLYLVVFAGIMAVSCVINAILVRKLSKITPAEVLKNRE